jgi:hypothetical protein
MPLQERIVCRHTKVGRIASINLGTSTLATQRMHCDYQLWMHLLTLSHHPRALIGQPPLTQRLFSVQWTPSDHFLPPFSPLLNFHFQLQGLLQRPGVRLDLKVPSSGPADENLRLAWASLGFTSWQLLGELRTV